MKFDIYKGDETIRFVLGKNGTNPLAIFGINPSTANQNKSDQTINKIEKLVASSNFNGFLMFNLYPFRTSQTRNLPKNGDSVLMRSNLENINKALQTHKISKIWAAWGDAFDQRNYLRDSLRNIFRTIAGLNLEWNHCESLTCSKNPRHPLSGRPHVITNLYQFIPFNVEKYLSSK